MRRSLLLLSLSACLTAGCSGDPATPAPGATPGKPAAATAATAGDAIHDEYSYAQPDKVQITDLVLDLDVLCVELLGRELWQCSPEQRGHVIRHRNALIADYLRGRTHYTRLILIATEAKPDGRAWWAERGADVKTILRPAKACFDAIDARSCPERVKAQQRAIVAYWR